MLKKSCHVSRALRSADMYKSLFFFMMMSLAAHAIRFNSLQYRECANKANATFKAETKKCFELKGKERSKCMQPLAKAKDAEIKECEKAEKSHKDKKKKCQMSMTTDQIPSFKDCHAMKNKAAKSKCINEKSAAFEKSIEECAAKK